MLTVLLGGARSGKSTAALRLAASADAVCFIATSPRIAGDDDLDARIAAHRAERPSHWRTIEAETDLATAVVAADDATVVIDCLTVWVGNLVHHGLDDEAIDDAAATALSAVTRRHGDTIAVTNEVGMGIVPADGMSRRYRDALGRVNQRWSAAAGRAYLLVAGRPLELGRWPGDA